jgi:hypothetical protein
MRQQGGSEAAAADTNQSHMSSAPVRQPAPMPRAPQPHSMQQQRLQAQAAAAAHSMLAASFAMRPMAVPVMPMMQQSVMLVQQPTMGEL